MRIESLKHGAIESLRDCVIEPDGAAKGADETVWEIESLND